MAATLAGQSLNWPSRTMAPGAAGAVATGCEDFFARALLCDLQPPTPTTAATASATPARVMYVFMRGTIAETGVFSNTAVEARALNVRAGRDRSSPRSHADFARRSGPPAGF